MRDVGFVRPNTVLLSKRGAQLGPSVAENVQAVLRLVAGRSQPGDQRHVAPFLALLETRPYAPVGMRDQCGRQDLPKQIRREQRFWQVIEKARGSFAMLGIDPSNIDVIQPLSDRHVIGGVRKRYSHAPGIAGLVGGLEVLGEMVFSTQEEKVRLGSGQIDYPSIE
jgi:hypothetical protein